MSANMAPALVRSVGDFVYYYVHDAQPTRSDSPKGFVERYIHSELYKRFPEVMCVIHAHADDVLPYTVSGVRLRAMNHMAGFVGNSPPPVFDIEKCYQHGEPHDMLVSSTRLGAELALRFIWGRDEHALPEMPLVLMRQHGFTTWGRGIKEAVYRAVYTTKNAKLQTTSTLLRSAWENDPANATPQWDEGGPTRPAYPLQPLTKQQAHDAEAANMRAVERPWGLWVQEVKCQPLYTGNVYQA